MLDFDACDWTVARVSSHCEFSAAYAVLELSGLVAFAPSRTTNKRVSRHSKRTEEVRVPLFPGYICIGWVKGKARDWDGLRAAVPDIRGALRLAAPAGVTPVDALLSPAAVGLLAFPEKESATLVSSPVFGVGDTVQFTDGPFRGLEFLVAETRGEEVDLYLSMFGSERNVTANAADLVEAR